MTALSLTRKIAECSGKNLEEYQAALHMFSPIENLSIQAVSCEVVLGVYDKIVPHRRGRELVEHMQQAGLNPLLQVYPASGHVETVIYFSRKFSRHQ